LQHVPRSHNYPGFAEGTTGPSLLQALRDQVERYDVEMLPAQADSISVSGQGFRVGWNGGEAEARCVLLATGATDIPPDMPYAAEALRDGALRYCPVCDGYEAIDQAIGVLTNATAGIREALYVRHFSARVTVFLAGQEVVLSEAERSQLSEASVDIAAGPVESVRFWNGRVTVRHGGRETICDTVYSALGMRIHSELALRLGAAADPSGYLQVDAHQQTSIPGLYAAGDVASGLNQISVAFGGAAIAASAIHSSLLGR
ncbi:MAG: NAD(P)/FAD-dependent oxidoreductase, partial [Pseudomonadota bacterium]|nr:NAD(P)/FAD-dependent oxidoreductase [Pseudomonadota bacterium]